MTLDDMMALITVSLRDAIWDMPEARLEDAPEDVYRDLAARFILKLARQELTIVPAVPLEVARQAEIARAQGAAAARIFEIFTTWLNAHRDCRFVTSTSPSGAFEIIMRSDKQTFGYFCGGSIQDAYAQAAQTVSFNEGELDENRS